MREFVRSLLASPRDVLFPIMHVLTVFLLGMLILRLIDSLLKRIARIAPTDATHLHRINHRTETLRHFVRSLGRTVLAATIIIMILYEIGLEGTLSTLLAGAGIASLAIAFGAQSLVKDVISGFFVLIGDQYGVGESVRIGTLEGVVEEMTLRVTVLRNADGEIHVIPNGSVQTVTVLSRDWRRALVDVEVSPKEELGRVFGVLAGINDTLSKNLSDGIIDRPQIIGIEKLTGNGITIRLAAKTYPDKQGEVALQWRLKIKETFDREGIRLAESLRIVS